MDDIEEESKKPDEIKPKTKDGKIINKLMTGEQQDSNQTEKVPDPFAAEQTLITDDDIAMAQAQRKGSYDDMDQEMGQPD